MKTTIIAHLLLGVLLSGSMTAQESVTLVSAEGVEPLSFPTASVPRGSLGVLNGSFTRLEKGQLWSDLLTAGGFGITNLAATDLDLSETKPFLGGFPVISCNASGEHSALVMRKVGGRNLALIGVAAPAPGRKQPRLEEPIGAVQRAVADAAGKADAVILLAAMTRGQAAGMLSRLEGIDVCLTSGRGSGDPQPLRIGSTWVCEVPWGGAIWGRTSLDFDAAGNLTSVTHGFMNPEGPASKQALAARKRHGLATNLALKIAGSARHRGSGEKPAATALTTASNRACRLTMRGMFERPIYGLKKPRPDCQFLVLDLELENTLPLTLVRKLEVPTQYRIPDLADHLYLVVNDHRVSRLSPQADRLPGHITVAGFNLDRLGARERGNVVFQIPREGVQDLKLRFYDYAHGHMFLHLRDGQLEKQQPVSATATNEVLQGEVFAFRKLQELGKRTAPSGSVFVEVEFLALSQYTFEGDATAFDPKAKIGSKIQIGTVADWKETSRYLTVVVDGERGYAPEPETALDDEPRFLPDLLTGNTAVFLVPERFTSLELRCDFPNASPPGKALIHPQPLVFLLEGKRPALPEHKSIVSIDDDIFRFTVTSRALLDEFAGKKAGRRTKFLVLDVTVHNTGRKGEFFQVKKQLKCLPPRGKAMRLDRATFSGTHRPAELVWLPQGTRRTFQVAFRIPESMRPKLAYHGITRREEIALFDNAGAVDSKASATGKPDGVSGNPPAVDPTTKPAPARPASKTAHAPTGPDLGRSRFIPKKEEPLWVERRLPNSVDLAHLGLGATLDVKQPQGVRWSPRILLDGDRHYSVRSAAFSLEISLCGGRDASVSAVGVVMRSNPKDLEIIVSAGTSFTETRTLGRITRLGRSTSGIQLLEFDAIQISKLSIQVQGEGQMSISEILVFEAPSTDRSLSVLSQGGTDITSRALGGLCMHLTRGWSQASNLLDRNPETAARAPGSGSPRVVLAFPGNATAIVESIGITCHKKGEHASTAELPAEVVVAVAPEDPLQGYTEVGRFRIAEADGFQSFRLAKSVEARFVRLELIPRPGQRKILLGELAVFEGTRPEYTSVLYRGGERDLTRLIKPVTLGSFVGAAATRKEIEPNDRIDEAGALSATEWLHGTLGSAGDHDLHRFSLKERERPEFLVHMLPSIQATLRILDRDGDFVHDVETPSRVGTTLRFAPDLQPGDYFLEIVRQPTYLLLAYDSSGSMRRTFEETRTSLEELATTVPDGMMVSIATTTADHSKRTNYTIHSPFTRDSKLIRVAAESVFQKGNGRSDWYNVLSDMLIYAQENVPQNSARAIVLLADGNGSGDFQKMWTLMSQTSARLFTIGFGNVGAQIDRHTSWDGARGLFNVAWYCSGRYFQPQDNVALTASYDRIFAELRTPPEYGIRMTIRTVAPPKIKPPKVRPRTPPPVKPTRPEPKRPKTEAATPPAVVGMGTLAFEEPAAVGVHGSPILFILDASLSMNEKIESGRKMRIAKRVLAKVVQALPDKIKVGLRLYGHRFPSSDGKRAAADSELVIPIEGLKKRRFQKVLKAVRARGGTPLAHSIQQARRDIRGIEDVHVILITDGLEGFGGDPVKAASQLGTRMTVVGFDIPDQAAQQNLRRMAEVTKGTYHNADSPDALVASLQTATRPVIPYALEDALGKIVARGVFGDKRRLQSGPYTCIFRFGGIYHRKKVIVKARETILVPLPDPR